MTAFYETRIKKSIVARRAIDAIVLAYWRAQPALSVTEGAP